MILEGIITTLNADGTVNIAPMGPHTDASISHLVLRPYRTSTTFENLNRSGQGVFHVTDDVQLLARAAIGVVEPVPDMQDAVTVEGKILTGACRWYAFRVRTINAEPDRAEIQCEVVDRGRLRDFWGFNRGRHAVLEAAILATRTAWLPANEILSQFEHLRVLVEKTGGPAEHAAFEMLTAFVQSQFAGKLR